LARVKARYLIDKSALIAEVTRQSTEWVIERGSV
jgi:hypothetical protein